MPRQSEKKVMEKVKKMIKSQIETKSNNILNVSSGLSVTNDIAPSSAVLETLSTCAQGTADYQRIGSLIDPQAVEVNYTVTYGDATNFIRVMLLQLSLDGLDDADSPLPDIYQPTRARHAQGFYTVLYDRIHNVSSGGDDQQEYGKIRVYAKRLRRMHYSDSGSSNVPVKGNLVLYAVSDSSAAAHPTLKYSSMLYYKDA